MKRNILLLCLLSMTGMLFAQTARVQIIHNSPSPTVDIYANGGELQKNFEYRTATPFIDVPAGVDIDLAIAPSPSTSAAEAIANFTVNLAENETYVVIATGIVGNVDTPFDLNIITPAKEVSADSNTVDLSIYHGSTDAPTVDIIARGVATLADNASFGDNTTYFSVPAADYTVDITPADNNDIIVASYTAPLSGLAGNAAVVFASGFLQPATADDPSFGVFAALPDGMVLELPSVENTAKLQIIHNSPSPTVDIWVNGNKFLPDFEYRSATPFLDVPAGTPLQIGVAPSPSNDPSEIIATFDVILTPEIAYVAMATGIVGNTETPFDLKVITPARLASAEADNVDFAIYHGATDAPGVDIIARGVATLADDLSYGENTDYLEVPADDYLLDITPANDNNVIVRSYFAPLATGKGAAAVVFASGFLNPTSPDDPEFGVFVVLPNGTVIPLPQVDNTARLQIIHNSPSPTVDIWVNGNKFLPDFEYRTATPFIDVPAGTPLQLGIAPSPSNDPSEIIATFDVNFTADETYVAIATGIVGNMDTPFDLKVINLARETANDSSQVDLLIYHGATDAPAVDIIARGVATLADGASYGDNTPYLSVPAQDYVLDITPDLDNSNVLVSYQAPLSGLAGGAAVAFASGFLDPATVDDPGFGIFVALADGMVIELPGATTSVQDNALPGTVSLTPTLVQAGIINVNLTDFVGGTLNWSILDANGRIRSQASQNISKNWNETIDVSTLNRGVYYLLLTNESNASTLRFVVQ